MEVVSGSTDSLVSCEIINVTSGAVMRSKDRKLSEDVADGSRIPRPPSRTGGASRSRTMEEHGGRPVSTGMRWCIAFSNGCSRSSMSGTVLSRYDQRLDKPCTYAAYAA